MSQPFGKLFISKQILKVQAYERGDLNGIDCSIRQKRLPETSNFSFKTSVKDKTLVLS